MPTRVADTIKQQNDLKTFPVAYSEDIWIDKNKGEGEKDYADLQELYNEGALGGSGLPTPESKDKLLLSVENEETSELEWSQVDKGTIDGSAYVNLDIGSDLNTLVTHGRFRTTTKRVDKIENVPVQVAGMLTVRLTGSVIYQTYNSIDNKMYTRTSEDAGENWSDWKDVSVGDSAFKGTHDDWDALTDEEKAQYETVIFTDDYGKRVIDDEKTSTDSTWSSKKINDSLVDIEDDLDELTDSVEDLTEIVASNEHGNALYINNTGEYLYKAGKTFTVPRSGTLSIVFYKETTGNTIFIERNGVRKLFFANYFSANFYMSLQLNVIKGDEVKVYTDVADTSAENRNYKLIHAIII